jgi:23S rRNA pseudouridine1911/1915/1917 synthase
VNGQARRPRDPVRAGDLVSLEAVPYPVKTPARPEPLPLNVVHEDAAILVINKQAGMVMHPGAGNPEHTLMNALLHHSSQLRHVPRAGIVHRLDKDTSGLLVVAKTPEAHTFLVSELKARRITREYRTIVSGVLTAGGTVDASLRRHARDRTKMAVDDSGRKAVTHYRVLKRFHAHTYLRVMLDTGRTHQIRVHMAHIGHPVLGDPVYGRRRHLSAGAGETLRAVLTAFKRQALHAFMLALTHPVSGDAVRWEAPLPEDMSQLLEALKESEKLKGKR